MKCSCMDEQTCPIKYMKCTCVIEHSYAKRTHGKIVRELLQTYEYKINCRNKQRRSGKICIEKYYRAYVLIIVSMFAKEA